MKTKVKICAGFNGIEHEAYIYKNIGGKKYCKSCTFKLSPQKPIRKMSDKQVFKMTLKRELLAEDKKFYTEVWIKRFFQETTEGRFKRLVEPHCDNPECGERLPDEPNMMYFHHILEKRNYPEHRHEPWNIAILCPGCHNLYETYPDKVPYLVQRRASLIEDQYIEKILNRK